MEKRLFTPGPLNTTSSVKAAVLRDVGSRDAEFLETVRFIRAKLLEIAAAAPELYTAIPLQGSGTFAVESVFANVLGKKKDEKVSQKLLYSSCFFVVPVPTARRRRVRAGGGT